MKSVFSEVEKSRLIKAQVKLLKDDLDNAKLMIEKAKYRGAYIFLFNAVERVIDIWMIREKRIKPSNRKEREELAFRFLPPSIFDSFKSFYYERRGGFYEDFILIERRDIKALLEFLIKVKKELGVNYETDEILEKIKSIPL